MLVSTQSPRLTAAQYLELEQISDIRHEYLAGDVYAIAANNLKHQLIAGNIYVYLQLKLWNSYKVDAAPSVIIDAPLQLLFPDVCVGKMPDRGSWTETHPILIIEVTSSCKLRDRSKKLLAYQNLAPLTEYAIVSQDRVQVEVYCLDNQNQWQRKVYGVGESVELLSVGLTMPTAQIYEDVWF